MSVNKEVIQAFHNDYIIDAYKYLGAFYHDNKATFRVYAPRALKISVIGDFNSWDDTKNIMKKIDDLGIFEIDIDNVKIYDCYKYRIFTNNKIIDKQDPYAFHSETKGKTASKIYDLNTLKFNDDKWIEKRSNSNLYRMPVNFYEVHLGSWKKNNDEVLNYKEIADKLIPYVKKMGYTHIELMPLTEYPFDGSWGYQVTGYYSITSRYGTPNDFAYLVNLAHNNGIGVVMDWVPAHFPKDDFGLCEFDGDCLYENPEPTKKEYVTWGTRIFNYRKPEVKSFLISSASFMFDIYHIDGLRVDAVAAMLYLDYDREKWVPNIYGGNYNLEAIEFLKNLNQSLFSNYKGIMMIAEESTSFPKVTHPVHLDGLGFNFKWSMGWMNDTLSYMKCDPFFRKYEHSKMTFASMYFFSENFILPISHDEVVHGKCSLLNKMPGEYEEKFSNMRAYLGYMYTHPGKKLNFMGYEFGQFIEWDYKKELDWFLLEYEMHKKMNEFVKKLNKFYLDNSELYEIDDSWDGFNWINADDSSRNVYTYKRMNKKGSTLYVGVNFSGIDVEYVIPVNSVGKYKEVLNSDDESYGGKNKKNINIIAGNQKNIKVLLPKLSIIIFKKE